MTEPLPADALRPYSMLTHNGDQLAKVANYYRAEVKRLQRENEELRRRLYHDTDLKDAQRVITEAADLIRQAPDLPTRIAELERGNEELRAEILRVAELRASAINELAKMSNHAAQLEAEKAELEKRIEGYMTDESEDEKKYLARIEQLRDTLELLIVKVEQTLWDRFEYTHAEIADQTKDYREILGRGPYRPEETA